MAVKIALLIISRIIKLHVLKCNNCYRSIFAPPCALNLLYPPTPALRLRNGSKDDCPQLCGLVVTGKVPLLTRSRLTKKHCTRGRGVPIFGWLLFENPS